MPPDIRCKTCYSNLDMSKIIVIAHDMRSTHNVGSLLRTAEGLGIDRVYLTGYTPYPKTKNDSRLPHIYNKLTKQINKTALGAETSQIWQHHENITELLGSIREEGITIIGLEQAEHSTQLPELKVKGDIAILLGREVEGISQELMQMCDKIVEIPMFGKKESFNVVEAATMALYHCKLMN